jgi:hypothetical protein
LPLLLDRNDLSHVFVKFGECGPQIALGIAMLFGDPVHRLTSGLLILGPQSIYLRSHPVHAVDGVRVLGAELLC